MASAKASNKGVSPRSTTASPRRIAKHTPSVRLVGHAGLQQCVRIRQTGHVTSASEVANYALSLAREAADDLAAHAAASQIKLDDIDDLLGSTSADDSTGHLHRETWERFAALQLVLAAKCIGQDQPQSEDESDDPDRNASEDYARGWKAFVEGDTETASAAASSILKAAALLSQNDWNHGNLIHDGHILQGYVRLQEGDLDASEAELRAAGNTSGSPQLDSFGPDLSLAWNLLKAGREQAVVDYLRSVSKFWSPYPPSGPAGDSS